MTTTINASTSSGLVVTPDNSGNVLLQYNGQGAPAFSAYASASQSVSNNTWTKITFDTEVFDTNNNFASSRFTPTVAGYYQINASMCLYGTSSFPIEQNFALYINGASVHWFCDISPNASLTSNNFSLVSGSTLWYFNGTTDYAEIYAYYYGSGASASLGYSNSSRTSRFSGCLLRGA
jgi:hypothetical protein